MVLVLSCCRTRVLRRWPVHTPTHGGVPARVVRYSSTAWIHGWHCSSVGEVLFCEVSTNLFDELVCPGVDCCCTCTTAGNQLPRHVEHACSRWQPGTVASTAVRHLGVVLSVYCTSRSARGTCIGLNVPTSHTVAQYGFGEMIYSSKCRFPRVVSPSKTRLSRSPEYKYGTAVCTTMVTSKVHLR